MRAVVLIALLACACDKGKREPPAPPAPTKPCVRGGCSGEICIEEGDDGATACMFLDEYSCFGITKCERQKDGRCDFTRTPELEQCIATARARTPPVPVPPTPPPDDDGSNGDR